MKSSSPKDQIKWQILNPAQVKDFSELEKVLLDNRNISDKDNFFKPVHPRDLKIKDLGIDQNLLKKSVQRLLLAREKKETVVIYGDYDADGICATGLVWQFLHEGGWSVWPFIPDRQRHGYGLSQGALEEIIENRNPDLIVTVDNGIVAYPAAKFLEDQGIDLIITDHHQPEGDQDLPPALGVVHSTKLCGATVGWILIRELSQELPELKEVLDRQLDLCGVATIADQVPLFEANRSFAFHGIAALKETQRPGLLALAKLAGKDLKESTESTVNFMIGPRINAMGRLKHGLEALRLLCTKRLEAAQTLAKTLTSTNTTRQDLTEDLFADAMGLAESWSEERIIVVSSVDYHEGVIGLIAGRLAEKFSRPAIVMSIGEDFVKASARSIQGVNIVELIRLVRSDLLEVGGHPMAAGFGLDPDNLEIVTQRLRDVAKDQVSVADLQPKILVDCELSGEMIKTKVAEQLQKFAPFGQKNPEPTFVFRNLEVLQARSIGKEQRHLKIDVSSDGNFISGIAWKIGHRAANFEPGVLVDIVANLQVNEWKGRKKPQLMIQDLRLSE